MLSLSISIADQRDPRWVFRILPVKSRPSVCIKTEVSLPTSEEFLSGTQCKYLLDVMTLALKAWKVVCPFPYDYKCASL